MSIYYILYVLAIEHHTYCNIDFLLLLLNRFIYKEYLSWQLQQNNEKGGKSGFYG